MGSGSCFRPAARSVDNRVIRTLVPVSVRADSERGTYNNKVSAMFAELPVALEDPIQRLQSIHDQMQDLKHSGQAVAAERLTALSGFAPAMLLALGGRVGTRLPQSSVNTVTTNVPGPQHPLYLAGRRMLEAFPFVPLGGHVRVGVAIFSYDGAVNFGVTGDLDTAPDIEILCNGIEQGIEQLLRTAVAGDGRQFIVEGAELRRGRSAFCSGRAPRRIFSDRVRSDSDGGHDIREGVRASERLAGDEF